MKKYWNDMIQVEMMKWLLWRINVKVIFLIMYSNENNVNWPILWYYVNY